MTDLAIRDTNPRALELSRADQAPASSGALVSLADWESELLAAGSIATKLCTTPFVPSHFRGKPADAAAAILTGHELGLSPMAALRSIFMISGTPGMYAKTMVAVVQAQGHHVWIEEQSKDRVIVCGRRKDWPADIPDARTTWDLERVRIAELLSNAQYKKNPQQMMVARGSAEICRQVAPDALLGIPYSVEELEDGPIRAEVIQAPRVTADEILGITAAADPAPVEPTVPVASKPAQEPEAPAEAKTVPPMAERIAKAIEVFAARGISQEQMEMKLGKLVAIWGDAEIGSLMTAYQTVISGGEFNPVQTPAQPGEPKGPTARHRGQMFALFADCEITEDDKQRDYMSMVLKRDVESRGSISDDECIQMIEALKKYKAQQEPAPGEIA